jgi:hypothetical protein
MTTNRQKLIDLISRSKSRRLAYEIRLMLDQWSDDEECREWDSADALWDARASAVDAEDRLLAKQCDDILIQSGYLVARLEGAVFVGKDRSCVRNGVRFDPCCDWQSWISS